MKIIYAPFCLTLVAALTAGACNSQKSCELTQAEKQEIAQEIEEIIDDFFSPDLTYEKHAALRADVEGYTFAGDGSIIFTDYESYDTGVKANFENLQGFIDLKSTNTSAYVLGPAAAVITTEFEGKYVTTEKDTIVHNGCWTFVFEKIDDMWKVVHENGTHTQ